MGLYKYLREIWKKPKKNLGEIWKKRLLEWRKEPVTKRIEKPTRLDKARSLGYKAKKGFIVVRQRIGRGGHTRPHSAGRRRSARRTYKLPLRKNYKQIAEERVQKKFVNLVVLNSYYVAEDGKNYWYEVILIDPKAPEIKKDKHVSWATEKKHSSRVFHGKTSAGRKARGLRGKGKGYEKARPSRRANKRQQ